jgi:hypothetical protein
LTTTVVIGQENWLIIAYKEGTRGNESEREREGRRDEGNDFHFTSSSSSSIEKSEALSNIDPLSS